MRVGGLSCGATKSELQLTLVNDGSRDLHWSAGIEGRAPWLQVGPQVGLLGPGASTTVSIRVNRFGLSGGIYLDRLYILADGEPIAIPVSMEVAESYFGPIQFDLSVQAEGLKVTVGGKVWSLQGVITRLTWQWGDGQLEEQWEPKLPVSHTYVQRGTYTIVVTAYSSTGHQRTKVFWVFILTPHETTNGRMVESESVIEASCYFNVIGVTDFCSGPLYNGQ